MSKKRIYIILCSLLLCLTVFAVITPFSVSETANAEPIIEEPDIPFPLEETKNYLFNLPTPNSAFSYGYSLDFDYISVMSGQLCNRMTFTYSGDYITISFYQRNSNGSYSTVGGLPVLIVHNGADFYYDFAPGFDVYNYMITVVNLPDDLFLTENGERNEELIYFISNFIHPTDYQVAYFVGLSNTSILSSSNPTQSYTPDYLFRVLFNDGTYGGEPNVLLYYKHYYGTFMQISSDADSPTSAYFSNGPSGAVMPRVWFATNPNYLGPIPYNSSYVYHSEYFNSPSSVGFKLGVFGSLQFATSGPNSSGVISVSAPTFFVTIDNSLALDTIIYNSFHNGYDLARTTYYDLGYNDGYVVGISDGLEDVTPWQIIVSGVNSFLSIEILPSVPLSLVLSVGFGLILFGLLIKLVT